MKLHIPPMLHKLHTIGLLAALALILGACAQPAPTPTVTPVPVTPTSSRPTLPPTWTPGPPPTASPRSDQGEQPAGATPVEVTGLPGRPTLPPTWTPGVAAATVTRPPLIERVTRLPTQPPTLTPALGLTAFNINPTGGPPTVEPFATYSPACAMLARSTPLDAVIFTGSVAHVTWTPVEGATAYQVWLLNPSGRYSYNQTTTETTIVFPAEAFASIGPFAWEVMPVQDGRRMCASLTGVINVRLAL